jgi:hypothetical protein
VIDLLQLEDTFNSLAEVSCLEEKVRWFGVAPVSALSSLFNVRGGLDRALYG